MIETLLDGLLAAATAALPGRVALLVPGRDAAWDYCACGEGQVWVRLISLVPFQTTGIVYPCGLGWNATIGVGALRCVAVTDDNGNPPSAAAQRADALGIYADMTALDEAVRTTMPAVLGVERLYPMRWDPLGPDGGCAGGEWQVMVKLGCL